MAELADGCTDRDAVTYLRAGQHSKNLMLLHALSKAAEDEAPEDNGPQSRARAAFQAGYRLLAQVQAERPDVVARVLSLPHIGGWAHDGLVRLGRGLTPDFGYLARVAAVAALRAGVRFELDIWAGDGQVRLPGLGGLRVKGPGTATPGTATDAEAHTVGETPGSWIRLSSDGERLTTDSAIAPEWTATPLIRAVANERPWEVLLETSDEHLDRFSLRPAPVYDAAHLLRWLQCIQSAWQVLARQRIWALDAIADTVAAIIPLAPHHEGEFISETTPAAFGAIATTWPPDPVMMAETLVHEYQHLKLGALLDMVPLLTPEGDGTLVYAPWRQDPRPAGGLLQGIYAHLAVARFWNAQRHLDGSPDDLLRAQVLYERWRPTVEATCDTLLKLDDCLTPEGVRFVRALQEQGRRLESGSPVPDRARDMAEEVALDHQLTWQLRHETVDPAALVTASTAFLRREPLDRELVSAGRVEAYTRPVGGVARSRLLAMRHLDPRRFRDLRGSCEPPLSPADDLLLDGRASEAAQAYRAEILSADSPVPHSWVGLAVAACRTAAPLPQEAFATSLPLLFEMHCRLADKGVKSDPMDLADWLT